MLSPATLLIITALLCTMMLLVMLSLRRSRLPGIREWTWAIILEIVALGCYLCQNAAPMVIGYVLANSLIALAICLFYAGCRRFFRLEVPWTGMIATVALVAVVIPVLRYPVDYMNLRVAFMSVVHGIISTMIAYTIIKYRPAYRATHGHMLTAVLALVFAIGYAIRGVVYLHRPDNTPLLVDGSVINLIFLSLGALIMPGLTMGAVVMTHDTLLSQAEAIANRDFLTGVLSRKAFIEQAQREMARASRYGRALALVMVDIDHFKAINDRYGHPTGDAILRDFALLAEASVRDGDYIGRLGGEEFGILLPDSAGPAAAVMAERLREQVAARRYRAGEQIVRYTLSAGMAVWQPGETIEDFVARSDYWLYQAKQSGRNRVQGDPAT